MPALFTSTSSPPKVSIAVLMRRWAPSQSATLSPLATASPPMALISSTTSPAGPGRAAAAVDLGAEVVDDDLGALAGELEGVAAADASPGAGDDDDPAVADSHCSCSFGGCGARYWSRSWRL